ncbi:RNA degradosome polyphosphate kinase [Temperatibacter marinus]|uniref:Polyphosphate kinase n=1 Tax=Temperatibacter marinus TaxID=1456591 RepID=A0AA52H9Y9_9PROT|nr:RNA degradosome polyphosphate kinase [Temperatibacter marinus]WND02180.1 RNA degradosome polyphosphate kinase [Temperatibacter marinus]
MSTNTTESERKVSHKKRIKQIPGSEKYLNRELSWLRFNMRVLEESTNPRHPLLERLHFLSISGNNLDEFYMVRVAGLRGQIDSGVKVLSDDQLSASEQLNQINNLADELMSEQQKIWLNMVNELKDEGINVLKPKDVSDDEKDWLQDYFLEYIFPLLTPIAVDPAHPFPFIPNLGFTMALSLSHQSKKREMVALLPIPHQVDRFIRLPGEGVRFISVEHLLQLFTEQLFPDYSLNGCGVFRIIRDSDLDIEDEAEDLVRVFESALKRRRHGKVIRLKMDSDMPDDLKQLIIKYMDAKEESVVLVNGILGINQLSELIVDDYPDLKFTPYTPRYPERVKDFGGDIFKAIEAKDFVVHHPYESFDVVIEFLRQAARDPGVVAIKQTLYRAGPQSMIIKALKEAAENGKNVTAVLELKARFDEEQNIKWARELERAGVHVVYGFIDLKTHAKVSTVIKRMPNNKLKTFCHFGTGNYHPITAKIYADLSYFTDNEALGRDVNRLFNYLTGYVEPQNLEKLGMSPFSVQSKLLEDIDQEIKNARAEKPAAVWAKMNSLLDPVIIDKLYEASCEGVQIDLVVRGICTLRPGVPGLSENIRVKSIVGRFLEHSRVVCFGNGRALPSKKSKVYISSADWMPRNFYRRVEALVPIENNTVHDQIVGQIMAANLRDNAQSWHQKSDGSYERVKMDDSEATFIAHDYFMTNPSMSGRGKALRKAAPEDLMTYVTDDN